MYWLFCEFLSGNIYVLDAPRYSKEKLVLYLNKYLLQNASYKSIAVYNGENGECVYAREV